MAKSGLLLWAQDTLTCQVPEIDFPFEIKDDPNLRISFPENSLPKGAKGVALAPVVVDEKGTLIKYCVNRIRILDSSETNSLVYSDLNMKVDTVSMIPAEIPIEKYPYYVRFIIERIYKNVKLINFVSNKPPSSKKRYQFSVIFHIE
jgi:hypothetical protein